MLFLFVKRILLKDVSCVSTRAKPEHLTEAQADTGKVNILGSLLQDAGQTE